MCRYMFDETLVTVWSAPNYCYRCGNVASILQISDVDTRIPKLFEVSCSVNNDVTERRPIFDIQAVPDDQRVMPPKQVTPYFL